MEVRLRMVAEVNRGELPRVRFDNDFVRVSISGALDAESIIEIEFEDQHTARVWASRILSEVERRYPTPPLPAPAVDDTNPPHPVAAP